NQLSADPARRVLLLEAGPDLHDPLQAPGEVRYLWGPDAPPAKRQFDWGIVAKRGADSPDSFPLFRGRVVGGSSAINAGIFLYALRDDMRKWRESGLTEWSDIARNQAAYAAISTPLRRQPSAEQHPEQRAFVEVCRGLGIPAVEDLNGDHTG